jgi:hypothetical protein
MGFKLRPVVPLRFPSDHSGERHDTCALQLQQKMDSYVVPAAALFGTRRATRTAAVSRSHPVHFLLKGCRLYLAKFLFFTQRFVK